MPCLMLESAALNDGCRHRLFGATPIRLALLFVCLLCPARSQLSAADPPASPEQAAAVLDLSSFPLVQPVDSESVLNRRIASQSYIARGSVAEVHNELKRRLIARGWVALEGGSLTDQYANETFQKSGFTLSMSVSMSGEPDQARVFMINHGNIDFKQLPLPDQLKTQYESPVMSMLASPWTVDETTEKISRSLIASGWQPYGSPVGSRQFKRNGVRMNVSIGAAPAQNNRTVVQISSEQMSADVPAPVDAEGVQYSDSTRQVHFDHAASLDEVFAMVRGLLTAQGWRCTSDAPIKIGFRKHLIFRNPAKDMMEVTCHQIDGKTRTKIQFKTKADIDALEEKLEAEAVRREAEMAKRAVREMIEVPIPTGAKIKDASESKVEFSLASGKALSALDAWVAILEKQGWKRTTNIRERLAGDLTLTKGSVELHVTYVDPGFIPASIDVSVFGKGTIKVK